ncbi:hypothetical protein HPP92_020950 [Vanilla planifolia]|uniref:Uncharacterized protein n=1 Tax=Vanilla planifolia TaxID=51239 RepID=A0A835UGQ7_VANPL|nr:hypothetical protein HPP92_020950 [Vanilla planifolia]
MAQENGKENFLKSMNVIRSPPLTLHPSVSVPNGTTYFLSNLDQNLVVTMKTLYCFPSTDRRSREDSAEVLRSSLQKVLTYFYPFDGRLAVGTDGKLVVLMDGGGVPFVEAEAEVELRHRATSPSFWESCSESSFTIPDSKPPRSTAVDHTVDQDEVRWLRARHDDEPRRR